MKQNSIWISIDGTEGSGKSTLAKRLIEAIPNSKLVTGFSNGLAGNVLKEAVKKTPWIMSDSILEQTMIILGDFFRVVEKEVMPRLESGIAVIMDRGYLSKYVYQQAILETIKGPEQARKILVALLELIPKPDLSVILLCDEAEQIERLRMRARDVEGEEQRMYWLPRANRILSLPDTLALVPNVAIQTSKKSPEAIFQEVLQAVASVRQKSL